MGITYEQLLNATPQDVKTTAGAWGKWREAVSKHANDLLTVNQNVAAYWTSTAHAEATAFIDSKHLEATTAAGVLGQVENTLSSAYAHFADAHKKLVATVAKAKANDFDCAGGHVKDLRPATDRPDSQATTNRANLKKTLQDDINAALREANSADGSVASALRGLMPGNTELAGGNPTGTGPGNGHGTPAAPVNYATSGDIPVPANATTLSPNPRAQQVINYALKQLGDPYVWGATGPDAFDCSGLTSQAYKAAGITIPRTSEAQYMTAAHMNGHHLFKTGEQPGDLVFFHMGNNGPGHVGIVLDPQKGTMIAAPHTGDHVKIQNYKVMGPVGFARYT